jgi:tRNA A-37 threonylcarbamoyl transferase component Bud32
MEQPRPTQLGPFEAPQIGEAQRRFWLIVDAMLVALVVVALVGGWAYLQVRGSLRELRTAGLMSLLEAEARALTVWIDDRKRAAERWASTSEVQREGANLVARSAGAGLCAESVQSRFRGAIAPYTAIGDVAVFNLIGRDGRIVSAPDLATCGAVVATDFTRELAPVFEGRTVFLPQWREADRLPASPAAAQGTPLIWVETPLRAADGTIVAALGFGRLPERAFAHLLALSVQGTSRDAYAFDESARIVTEPRYAGELAAVGARTEALHARDPGGDLLAGHRAAGAAETRAPTRLAQAAFERQASQGVLIEPYRNYRGAEVIGAWRWIPDARLVVAVELEAGEAFGSLETLQIAFGALFALVLASMTAAASTSLWAMRARLREARRLGAYRIERLIGQGGMSDVYLAHHEQLKRVAAVKVLKAHLATDEAVARFRREAQLCSQLAHPNTVEVYDYGTTREGRWYYAMEYLEGISLEDLVRRHGPMPAGRAVHALRQACASLAEAHARGWVHRDVKPGNLMLCVRGGEYDVVKLVDFGIVKPARGEQTRDITQHSRVLGTPLYMAPERLRNPADADARADIYALGAVTYFILCGRAAFAAETEHDTLYKVMNEPAPALVAPVPEALVALVARCLRKERSERPGTIHEVRAVLDQVASELPWSEAEARAWWEAHPEARGGATIVS